MINKHSDDPNIELAAEQAVTIVNEVLGGLPKAETFDYGGHYLRIGEYDVCAVCTVSIAEAQQASKALLKKSSETTDPTIKEHLDLAAQLFKLEAEEAVIRAELHNGQGTEPILDTILGFQYDRKINDDYNHNHAQAAR